MARCQAVGEVVYVSWDPEKLKKCLETDAELELRFSSLLARTMERNMKKVMEVRGGNRGGVGSGS
ncbi:unnamed protein product [Prorocentrum cordatum]|uniref:Uncharacterized protein n=1 Tax=Prorocentrum cordatum TaxID=2364126 RepID=A0ABN9UMX5_9DINO|nr:unnamed protein product [Polarella glacialis]